MVSKEISYDASVIPCDEEEFKKDSRVISDPMIIDSMNVGRIETESIKSKFFGDACLKDITLPKIQCPVVDWNGINNPLFIESYEPSPATYAGRQRGGIRQSISNAISANDHIREAFNLPSQFPDETPIPKDVRRSLPFIDSVNDNEIKMFRPNQIEALRGVAKTTRVETDHWYSNTPLSILEATGVIYLSLLSYLLRKFEMGSA